MYTIVIPDPVQKQLKRLTQQDQNRIVSAIDRLVVDPRPIGVVKLKGRDAWRIRVGVHRLIYEIIDDKLIILMLAIGHRKDVYRK